MPAPRACSAADERSKTVTSQPASRRTSAAVKPPTDPPTIATRGMPDTALGPPERGDLHHRELEQDPPLVHRPVTQGVGRVAARGLHPDPVQLVADPPALRP